MWWGQKPWPFRRLSSPPLKSTPDKSVNAQALCQALIGYGFQVVSGGTDNHLMLIDLRNKKINGKQAQLALDEANITTNKNSVPYDTESPLLTSGLRLGTPALTTRGFRENEFKQVAKWINQVISSPEDEAVRQKVKGEIAELSQRFPLYPELLKG